MTMKRSRPHRRKRILLVSLAVLLLFVPAALALPLVGRVDDFQNGTTMGWVGGQPLYTTLVPVAEGGPQGENDGFLQVSVDGFHLGTKNSGRSWTGDYLSSGVTAILEEWLACYAEPVGLCP